MRSILTVGTYPDRALSGLLEKGALLAGERQLSVVAVCFCPELTEKDVLTLTAHGADRIIHAAADPDDLNAEVGAVAVLEELARRFAPEAILFLSSVFLGAVAPMLAARLNCGMTADCTELHWSPAGTLLQSRPTFGGRKLATIESAEGIAMATVRKGAFPASGRTAEKAASVEWISLPEGPQLWRDMGILDRFGSEQLTDARLILAGGLGLGTRENFRKLEALTKAIGASAGASRAAVAAGFASYQHQVGQTGVSVRPELYVAFGISGAVQHLSGITGAKRICAVNHDPKAPIHAYADISVVADCVEVLDSLCERIL